MTSDAKIGLLLGLVFIFIIAFIINGLPNFRNTTDSNELPTNMITFEDGPLGIGTKERKTQEVLDWMEPIEKRPLSEVPVISGNEQDIRSVTPLPGNSSTAKKLNESNEIKPKTALVIPPAQPTWPKTYVVSKGDNLASIAKKFYGSEEGNRRINIDRIFETNRKQLRSPDEIYVGQKLIIPRPSNVKLDENKIGSVLSGTLFEKVKSIGRKHLSMDGQAANQGTWYIVRQGDSLWKIAAEQLGNGTRYTELKELNANILDEEDNLVIGIRLRIPAQ